MPGIFGAMATAGNRDPHPVAAAMQDLLTHRPWYEKLLYQDGHCSAGAVSTNPYFARTRHLAVAPEAVLLVEGTAFTVDGRPLADDSPDLAERLLACYLSDGDDFILRIGGHFNLVLIDRVGDRALLCNDRSGFAHMYWYAKDGVFLFAPELKAFLAWRGFPREPDQGAFAGLLLGCCYGKRTLLRDVVMLEPGSRVIWSGGRVEVQRYWRPEPRPEEGRDASSWIEEALPLYRRALAKRIPAAWEGRVVVPLSGGLDSRLLISLAREHGDRLEIFTHGQPECYDYQLAKQIAGSLDLGHRHHLIEIDPDWYGQYARQAIWLNDGQLDFRNAFLIGVSQAVGEGAVPFLNGIIGAYMSLGVGTFSGQEDFTEVTDPAELRRQVFKYYNVAGASQVFHQYLAPAAIPVMTDLAKELIWESFQPFDHVPLLGDCKVLHMNANIGRRIQGSVDIHKFFFNDLIPFVDEELHDLWLRIPYHQRLDNQLYHEMYRTRLADQARIPWSHTRLDLFASADEIKRSVGAIKRRQNFRRRLRRLSLGLIHPLIKENYSHREYWLRRNKGYREVVTEALSDVGSCGCDWFDQGRVDRMAKDFFQGKDYLWNKMMQVATIQIWFDMFIKNGPASVELGSLPAGGTNRP